MTVSRQSAFCLSVFLVLTAACYFLGFWLIFRLGRATPLMLSVGVAAILTCLLCKRPLADLGWRWGDWAHQRQSYLLPLAIVLVSYGAIWLLDLGAFYPVEYVETLREDYNLSGWHDVSLIAFQFALVATISFIGLLPAVLGEEIAWRGFLVPELARSMSFTGVSLVSGLLWSAWHWPLVVMGLYGNEATPLAYQLACFTIYIVSLSIIMAYLRLKTGSLWTAVIFHMSLNVFLQKFFDPLTTKHANSDWFINEFGAVTAVVALIFAIPFLLKGRKEFG